MPQFFRLRIFKKLPQSLAALYKFMFSLMHACYCSSTYGATLTPNSAHLGRDLQRVYLRPVNRLYISWSPRGPEHPVGALPRRAEFKVYVLTSWYKWVQYPAPRPSPQPLHRRAICAAKSSNSAPRTKHLENQLDLFLHGRADCQTTQGF